MQNWTIMNKSKYLKSKLDSLELYISDSIKENATFALSYALVDPKSSLNKSRNILETILNKIFVIEMQMEPKSNKLYDILKNNQFNKKIDRNIISRMNSIRDMGNLGSHGYLVTARDALDTLENVFEILEWYVKKYNNLLESTDNLKIPNNNLNDINNYSSVRNVIVNKKSLIIFILVIISFLLSYYAYYSFFSSDDVKETNTNLISSHSISTNNSEFLLIIDVGLRDDKYLAAGDTLRFSIIPNKDSYLRVVYELTTGEKVLLIDNKMVLANQEYLYNEGITIAEPFGEEALIIKAQKKRFPKIRTHDINGLLIVIDDDLIYAAKGLQRTGDNYFTIQEVNFETKIE